MTPGRLQEDNELRDNALESCSQTPHRGHAPSSNVSEIAQPGPDGVRPWDTTSLFIFGALNLDKGDA